MQVGSVHLVGIAIVALGLVMSAALVAAVRKTSGPWGAVAIAVVVAWGASGAVAAAGVLARFDARPPPMVLFMAACLAAGVFLGASVVGAHLRTLPLWVVIGSQAFRLPLELAMHQAAVDGVMPLELSFSGYNFDIVTGITAIIVAVILWRKLGSPKMRFALAWAWNVVGISALISIVAVAILSSPMVRFFGDDPAHLNTWVTEVPYVWLPAILVAIAVAAHVVVTRALAGGGVGAVDA